MNLDLTAAINQLKSLQEEMNKVFGTSKGGVITMTMNLDTSNAKQALKELSNITINPKVVVDTGNVKSQITSLFNDRSLKMNIQTSGVTQAARSAAIMPQPSQQRMPNVDTTILKDIMRSYQTGGNMNQMMASFNRSILANAIPNFDYKYKGQIPNMPQSLSGQLTNFNNVDFKNVIANAFRSAINQAYQSGGSQRVNTLTTAANKAYGIGTGMTPNTAQMLSQQNAFRDVMGMPPLSSSNILAEQYKRTVGRGSVYTPYGNQQSNLVPRGTLQNQQTQQAADPMRNVFGLYMMSQAMSSIAYKLDGMFSRVAESYDTSALSFRKTQLVAGMPSDQFESYKNSLLDLAGETMTHVPTLAEMGYSFATRGYMDPETAKDVIRPLAISGLITGEDPVTMGKSVMSLMQAWNPMSLTSLEREAPRLVGEFSDLSTYAYANSPLETRWFKDIANYAAPVFAGLGFDPTETLSAFMAMSQMIPTPGIGARSSRMAISNLFDVNKLSSVSEKYGVDMLGEIERIKEAGGGIAEVLEMVANQINSLPDMQQNAFMREIGGGVRGGMAFQALLPVIGNISEYQREMEANAAGYTMRKQFDYAGTPYGQLQSAEAEREAIMYGTGEKTVGIRTSIMKLENTILKLIQKLPEGVLAAGYSAGKGFEGVAELTSGFANLAILKALAPKTGTMFGAAGAILTPAMFIGPLVAGLAGAIADGIQRGDIEEAKRTAEKTEDLDIFEAAKLIRDDFTAPGSLGEATKALEKKYLKGEISTEEYDKRLDNLFGDNFWDRLWGGSVTGQKNQFVVDGKSVGSEELTALFKQSDAYFKESVPWVAARMPGTEEEKEALQTKLEEYGALFKGSLGDFTAENIQRRLAGDIEATGRSFGEIDEGVTDPVERYKQSQKNIEEFVANADFGTMPDLGDKYDWSVQSLLVEAYKKQIDPTWKHSDDDMLKLSSSEAMAYFKETYGTDKMKSYYGEENVSMMTDAFGKTVSIINSIDEKTGITAELLSEISDNVKEINSPMDATYGELFDAWTSGFLGTDTLPGLGDFAPLSLGYNSEDFAGTAIPGFNFKNSGGYSGSALADFMPLVGEEKTKKDTNNFGDDRLIAMLQESINVNTVAAIYSAENNKTVTFA
jgi:TP901 family phage tail tape measure protein